MTHGCLKVNTSAGNDTNTDCKNKVLSHYTDYSKRKVVSERWNILCSNTSEVLYEILLKII